MDTLKVLNIIVFKIDYTKPSIVFETDWIPLVIVILLLGIIFLVFKFRYNKAFIVTGIELELSKDPNVKFKFERNAENLFIANRIYIELKTRKAALEIEDDKDVIDEIYNSWYQLFLNIRTEIKNVPGEVLRTHKSTEELIGLTIEILNLGLRPHLTTYQAKFKRWYKIEIEETDNNKKSPQEIQKEFVDYDNLIKDMKQVNRTLIKYAEKLKNFIDRKY